MVSSCSVITESSGHRAFTKSLASQSSRVERFSRQRIFSARRAHGKRSERFAPRRRDRELRSRSLGLSERRPLSTSGGFQFHSVRSHNQACTNGSASVPLLQLGSASAVRWKCKVCARPSMPRHRSKIRSVLISRLTLPSSGPAFGGPLKSNVRRHNSSTTLASTS